jgi:DNA polymerase elongation subunit (family B)
MSSPCYTNVVRHGDSLMVRGYKNNVQFLKDVEYQPHVYVPSNDSTCDAKSFYGAQPLKKITFGSMSEADQFLKDYKGVEGMSIHGSTDWIQQFIGTTWRGDLEVDTSPFLIYVIDIETTANEGFPDVLNPVEEILLISLTNVKTGHTTTWGRQPAKFSGSDVSFNFFPKEEDLLNEFLLFLETTRIDVLTGWNVDIFDMPYLYARMKSIDVDPRRMSPYRKTKLRTSHVLGKERTFVEIKGLVVIDYLDLYKKFTLNARESYKLDAIAFEELGENKLDYSEHGSFMEFVKKDWQKFCAYNVHDCILVKRLDDKLKFIDLAINLAYVSKLNFDEIFGPVKMWDTLCYNYLLDKGIAIPPRKGAEEGDSIPGGYVKDPQIGKHGWVVSFDATSLYPSTIITLNISPETFAGRLDDVDADTILERRLDTSWLKEKNLSLAANGAMFRRDVKGMFPDIMESLMTKRKVAKKRMLELEALSEKDGVDRSSEISALDGRQNGLKVGANAGYGALLQESFRYFSRDVGSAVTVSGQAFNRTTENTLNSFMNKKLKTDKDYVILADTDSVTGDTLVDVGGESMRIDALYDRLSEFTYSDDFNKSYVKPTSGETTLSFNTKTKLSERKSIKYVMKHLVKKEMFKITVGDKSVVVTEDHSVIIKRNYRFISVKPKDIKEGDIVISLAD